MTILKYFTTVKKPITKRQINGNFATFHKVALPIHCFQVKLEFGMLVFAKGGKLNDPKKNPRSKDQHQQQTQPTCDTNPSHSGGRQALLLLHHPCSHAQFRSQMLWWRPLVEILSSLFPPTSPFPPGVWIKASYNCPYNLQQSVDFITFTWGFQTHQKLPNFIFNLHGYQPCLSVSLVATVWSCHTTCPLSAQWGRERDDIWPDKTKQTLGDLRYRIQCFLKNSLWSCFL